MLQLLEIHNIALIDKVKIEFGEGLNVLTGETGAGKSIIIDSINAVLGERVSKDLIKTDKDKAMVEAVFNVPKQRIEDIFINFGIPTEEDGTIIISREFTLTGRNICRVNGILVTVSTLKEIGSRLIDMHGQHDNQSLLRTESHIDLLDLFGGARIGDLKSKYLELLEKYKEIKNSLKALTGEEGERERKIDLLKFQIDEIAKANLIPGEEEKLNKHRILLSNSEKILNALNSSYELLYSGEDNKVPASETIGQAISELKSISRFDSGYQDIADRLENISYLLYDLIDEIRKERDNIEYDPSLLEEIEQRLDTIYKLKRKYGRTVEEILQFYNKAKEELEKLSSSQETIAYLHDKLKETGNQLYKIASDLNSERLKAALLLESKICSELEDLEMKSTRFKTSIKFEDSLGEDGHWNFTQKGMDRVEFLISTNPGEPLKPLSKIASGGEMSRIMLAIKTILADVDQIPTLIFDEIDIGISGIASQKVGEKLSLISQNHQVICVTHLPQIASMADCHFLIEKISENEKTLTKVKKLEGKEIVEELSRIMSGTHISEITRKHAEELLFLAKNKKR
ncbi:MAG TPA: DNA repair protein RecN [Clostridiaceae bacterium]|nr:DNA repair protein RecN [Clostridiaceae bacterium]